MLRPISPNFSVFGNHSQCSQTHVHSIFECGKFVGGQVVAVQRSGIRLWYTSRCTMSNAKSHSVTGENQRKRVHMSETSRIGREFRSISLVLKISSSVSCTHVLAKIFCHCNAKLDTWSSQRHCLACRFYSAFYSSVVFDRLVSEASPFRNKPILNALYSMYHQIGQSLRVAQARFWVAKFESVELRQVRVHNDNWEDRD